LRVRGMDLLDGTPILDIKPYVPYADAFPQSRAGWIDAIDASQFFINHSVTCSLSPFPTALGVLFLWTSLSVSLHPINSRLSSLLWTGLPRWHTPFRPLIMLILSLQQNSLLIMYTSFMAYPWTYSGRKNCSRVLQILKFQAVTL